MMAAAPEDLHEVPEVHIRPMLEIDLTDVAAIEQKSYAFPWSENIFRDCLRVGYTCRALDLAGQVIGYGVMSLGAGEAHILNRLRARRIPHAWVSAAACSNTCWSVPRRPAISEAFLEVRPSNLAAIRLYQRLGFEQIGIRRGYYQAPDGREDAIVLKLELRQALSST